MMYDGIHAIDWPSWTAEWRATLLFVVRDGHILLIEKKRGFGKGKINGPGGRIEPGETPLQGAIREVQEEICVTPTGITSHGELQFQFQNGFSIHGFVFRADDMDGAMAETDEARPFWQPVDRIPYDRMWEDDRHWLPFLLDRKRFTGRFLFDEDRMVDYTVDVHADPEPVPRTP